MPGMLGESGDQLERLSLLPHPRGMLASEGRGSVMSPGVDWTNWIAPQWLASLAAAVQAPRQAYQGEGLGPQDAMNVALNTMGGGMLTGRGSGAGMNVFHAGPERIKVVNPSKLQQRDSGFYGKGFYVSETPNYWYGSHISQFDLPDNVKMLQAARHPEGAPDLADTVAKWYYDRAKDAAAARGKLDQLAWETDQIRHDHNAFVRAVDQYAEANGYQAVRYTPHEIVVKDPSVLKAMQYKSRGKYWNSDYRLRKTVGPLMPEK